jgi:hypothetical protein
MDIATDTGRSDPVDVYLSYHPDEEPRAQTIFKQLDTLGKTCFDEGQIIPGTSKIASKEHAMGSAKSIAILVGASGLSPTAAEEATQGLRHSIDNDARVFLVRLPGYKPENDLPMWLQDKQALDLRDAFENDETLTFEGLVRVIGAVNGEQESEARKFLNEWFESNTTRPPRCRALIAAVQRYENYDDLPGAEFDRVEVKRMLDESDQEWWQVDVIQPRTKAELVDALKRLLLEDVTPDDTLLFYFSGHGDLQDGDAVLCVGATDPNDMFETSVQIKQLANYVRQSESLRKIVLLDCCFSGEASDGDTYWGKGAAVVMTSRQWVPVKEGVSEMTSAVVRAWRQPVATSGALLDSLNEIADIRSNRDFEHTIPLPLSTRTFPASLVVSPSAARLTFNDKGDMSVSLSDGTRAVTTVGVGGWLEGRRQLVDHMVQLVDAVVSLVPPDRIPMQSVKDALSSLGSDLLSLTLTEQVRDELVDLRNWDELHLQLSFDDRWPNSASWERVPWECLSLCLDDDRPVTLERIVRAKATKSNDNRQPPRRVIAWNSFIEPNPSMAGSKHLFTHLLRQGFGGSDADLTLTVKEPAVWEQLFDASKKKVVSVNDHGDARPITDFDTLTLFAPVTLGADEPEIWLYQNSSLTPINATPFVTSLRSWTCNYVILETVAGFPVTRRAETSSGQSRNLQARSLQATTQLATRLARQLSASVVAVCHSPYFLQVARATEDSPGAEQTFAGALLAELADPSKGLQEAASEARRVLDARFNFGGSLHVGLPVVCRPESSRVESRPAGRSAPRVRK